VKRLLGGMEDIGRSVVSGGLATSASDDNPAASDANTRLPFALCVQRLLNLSKGRCLRCIRALWVLSPATASVCRGFPLLVPSAKY
jgi:hypothetical protein